MNPDSNFLLFVYGSLRRGYSNQHRLGEEATFVKTVAALPRYRLYDYGQYPALLEAEGAGAPVQGEVWSIPKTMLPELDAFECVAEGLYRRDKIKLAEDLGTPVETYFYARSVGDCPDCGDRWIEGHPYWEEGWRFAIGG